MTTPRISVSHLLQHTSQALHGDCFAILEDEKPIASATTLASAQHVADALQHGASYRALHETANLVLLLNADIYRRGGADPLRGGELAAVQEQARKALLLADRVAPDWTRSLHDETEVST